MKFLCTPILFIIIFTNSFSQPQGIEDISLEMLRETQSPTDSSAVAEVLYEKGKVSFLIMNSWEYNYEVIRRIKIYTPEGYEQANVQIPYYVGDSNSERESVSNIEGYVYYEKEGEIEREKIRNKDIFEVSLSELWEAKKFTLPKIQDGVIIEYSYTINSPHIRNLPKWVFQNTIPTRYSEYTTRIPAEYLSYNIRTKGYYPLKSIDNTSEGSLYVKGRTPMITSIRETKDIATNLPEIKNETYVNNVTNYLPSRTYELSSYKTGKYEPVKIVSRSWEDVMNTLRETDTYEREMSRTNYFEEDLEFLIGDISSPKEKMEVIYEYVKNKMAWDGKERKYTSDKLNKVYELGVGNSADINIMLTAMLREAKLEASPVLSSTISNGIPLFPTISGLNYVFTQVSINGETFLLDATEKFSEINILPKRALNWKGAILKPDGFEELELVPKEHSIKKYQIQASLTSSGMLEGKCRIISMNQFGLISRKSLDKKSDDEVVLNYQTKFNLKGVKEVSVENFNKSSKPLLESFSFSDDSKYVEQIGDKLYISPMLFLKLEKNPFNEKERIYPIDFSYPRSIDHMISIQLPEGYKVAYLPEKAMYKLGDDNLTLTYLIQANNDRVTVKVNQSINTTFLLPEGYQHLKQFYTDMITKENEKIVLVKI